MHAKSSDEASTHEELIAEEQEILQGSWHWFLFLGVALVLLGMIAIAAPLAVGLATAVLFGVLLVAGGVALVVHTFTVGDWRGKLVELLQGILYIVVGGLAMRHPEQGLGALTLLLAAFFIVGGLFRMIAALQLRFANWGWTVLGGGVSLFMGLLIWARFPETAVWIIGLFIGIEMLLSGWSWIMLAFCLQPEAKKEE